jgi:hypothetical protein
MTPSSLSIAFKEWAAICQALDEHHQCLLLRKGGISEDGGRFQPEHSEFLLYPTYFHEHSTGLKPDYQDAYETAEALRPAQGTIFFTLLVRVTDVQYITSLDRALALDPLHGWTPEIVRQRFEYRQPGLYVLSVRAYRLTEREYRIERPEYAGCKTWVTIEPPVPISHAFPVLTDEEYAERTGQLQRILQS